MKTLPIFALSALLFGACNYCGSETTRQLVPKGALAVTRATGATQGTSPTLTADPLDLSSEGRVDDSSASSVAVALDDQASSFLSADISSIVAALEAVDVDVRHTKQVLEAGRSFTLPGSGTGTFAGATVAATATVVDDDSTPLTLELDFVVSGTSSAELDVTQSYTTTSTTTKIPSCG